jgi:sugar (pentulose or hexulose) kinase
MSLYLGIDCGTQSLTAIVIEIEERSLVSRYAPDVVTQIAETVSRFSGVYTAT